MIAFPRVAAFLGMVFAVGLAAHGAESVPAFSAGPTFTKTGTGYEIAFTVSAPTDVEVAIVNAKGKVVRSLAAGVLKGANPPPEPLQPGLAQKLTWDQKDDFGKAASDGPFKL